MTLAVAKSTAPSRLPGAACDPCEAAIARSGVVAMLAVRLLGHRRSASIVTDMDGVHETPGL